MSPFTRTRRTSFVQLLSLALLLVCVVETKNIGPRFLKDQMYTYYAGDPCVKLLGRDGITIGCSTNRDGVDGWMYPVENQTQLLAFRESHEKGDLGEDLVLLLASDLFTPEIVKSFPKNVKGLLILPGLPPDGPFSPAAQYPNKENGLYPNSTMIWNPSGTAWNFERQSAQIFALDLDTAQMLLELANENVATSRYPKWAMRLTAHMYTENDKDVETCLRRENCQPLGGMSVWGSLNQVQSSSSDRLILAAAAMDSNAFFHDRAVGSDADISGTVALLGAIQALAQVDRKSWQKQPVFAFFNGEAYGFIGSHAFVKDITNFTCIDSRGLACHYPYRVDTSFKNIHLDMIDAYIELNQVGHIPNDDLVLYPHTDANRVNTSLIQEALRTAGQSSNVRIADDVPKDQELPPSSLMSFLQVDRTLPGVVLTDHRSEYTNQYFQSRFDELENVNMTAICKVSETVARSIFLMGIGSTVDEATGLNVNDIHANCSEIVELFSCFTLSYDCELVRRLIPNLRVGGTLPRPTNYVGVYEYNRMSYHSQFIWNYIANLTASDRYDDFQCYYNEDCTNRGYDACLDRQCVRLYNAHSHEALSPAFEYDSVDTRQMKLVNDSIMFPQWVEPYWVQPSMEVYMIDEPWIGVLSVFLGIFQLVYCLVGMYFLTKYIHRVNLIN